MRFMPRVLSQEMNSIQYSEPLLHTYAEFAANCVGVSASRPAVEQSLENLPSIGGKLKSFQRFT